MDTFFKIHSWDKDYSTQHEMAIPIIQGLKKIKANYIKTTLQSINKINVIFDHLQTNAHIRQNHL